MPQRWWFRFICFTMCNYIWDLRFQQFLHSHLGPCKYNSVRSQLSLADRYTGWFLLYFSALSSWIVPFFRAIGHSMISVVLSSPPYTSILVSSSLVCLSWNLSWTGFRPVSWQVMSGLWHPCIHILSALAKVTSKMLARTRIIGKTRSTIARLWLLVASQPNDCMQI